MFACERITATLGSRRWHGRAPALDIETPFAGMTRQLQKLFSVQLLKGIPVDGVNLLGVPRIVKKRPPVVLLAHSRSGGVGSGESRIICRIFSVKAASWN